MVERATSGSMMIERAKPPAIALWWCPMPTTGSGALTMIVKTKMPITIDGKPLSTSSQSRICRAIRSGANSLTYRAVSTPKGSAIAVAIATSSNVPDDRWGDPATGLAEARRPLDEEVEVECADTADEDPPDDKCKRSDRQRGSQHRQPFGDLVHEQPAARAAGCLEAESRFRHQPPVRWNSKRLTIRCAA